VPRASWSGPVPSVADAAVGLDREDDLAADAAVGLDREDDLAADAAVGLDEFAYAKATDPRITSATSVRAIATRPNRRWMDVGTFMTGRFLVDAVGCQGERAPVPCRDGRRGSPVPARGATNVHDSGGQTSAIDPCRVPRCASPIGRRPVTQEDTAAINPS
jgi:hypothetical protein